MDAQVSLERFQQFRRAARDAVVPVELTPLATVPFRRFHVRQLDLEPLRICDVACDPVRVRRRPEQIESDRNDDLLVVYQVCGAATVHQGDRDFTINEGDLAILSANQPYNHTYLRPSRRLFVCMPSSEVRGGVPPPLQPRVIRRLGGNPVGRIASTLMMSVALDADGLGRRDRRIVGQGLLDILASVIRNGEDAIGSQAPIGAAERILVFMEANFKDPELTPARIAMAHDISLRRLHAIVSATGTTVNRWIWERRLQACHAALQSPLEADRSISDIAFEFGFNDAAHFSRAFRMRFGSSPREVRLAAGKAAGGSCRSY